MKAKRLSAPGRHERENVPSRERVLHDLLLQRPKSRVAEMFFEGALEFHVYVFTLREKHAGIESKMQRYSGGKLVCRTA